MADRFVAEPGKITEHGFRDMASHRQANAAIYNNYDFISKNARIKPGMDYLPIIRPLFTTSYLLYHFFNDNQSFGAKQVILTSASSKTAMAMAAVLKDHQSEMGIKIIGTTSSGNKSFVESTGFYDEVYSYNDVDQIKNISTSVADFSGNKQFLLQLDEFLGDELKFISAIGLTDWESNNDPAPVAKAKFFFAPTYAQEKFNQWGVAEGTRMIQKAMMKFIAQVAPMIQLNRQKDLDSLKQHFDDMVKGNVNPKEGLLINL